jgi:hypothetical protein
MSSRIIEGEEWGEVHGAIIKKLKEWFEQTHFKSFASLVLHEPSTGTPFGVLNIEANGKNIFGASDEAKHGIGNLVRPLQTALEYIIDYQASTIRFKRSL